MINSHRLPLALANTCPQTACGRQSNALVLHTFTNLKLAEKRDFILFLLQSYYIGDKYTIWIIGFKIAQFYCRVYC